MLRCRATSWRCVRALPFSSTSSSLFACNVAPLLRLHSRPQHTSSLESAPQLKARPEHHAQKNRPLPSKRRPGKLGKSEPWSQSREALRQRKAAKATLTAIPPKKGLDEQLMVGEMWLGKRDPRIPVADWNARRRELRWLKDPLEVADFVKKSLAKGREKEMLLLVRMASHSMQCIVSWNHIIDYYMAEGKISNALKIYTEMKRRAQFPDSYTYTILLRGLSNNVGKSEVTSKALSIYYSMFAPNSRVEPSILHTNVALRVCARALDMDALWSIVSRIPPTGPGAADSVTYTTILNAIRQSLIVDVPKDEDEEEVARRRERGVAEGRRIWGEIVAKWRNAELAMEEDLVSSMARLLLISSRPRDWDDVLSLVEQTMDIPRFVPRLGTPERQAAGVPRLRAPHTPIAMKLEDLGRNNEDRQNDVFLPPAPRDTGRGSLLYATPGNNILSAVLEACQKTVVAKAADEYWNTITDPTMYGVVPDVNNLHHRLRLFRQNRASTAALATLKEDFLAKELEPWPSTFRIIMSTCVRDKNNHNSLKTADEVLTIMLRTLPDVDLKTVTMHAKLATSFPLATGDDLVRSLSILYPIVKNIRLQLGVGAEDEGGKKGARPIYGDIRREAMDALRQIYAVYDKLLLSGLLAREKQAPFKAERARLSAFINRQIYKYNPSSKDLILEYDTDLPDDHEASSEKSEREETERKASQERLRSRWPLGERKHL